MTEQLTEHGLVRQDIERDEEFLRQVERETEAIDRWMSLSIREPDDHEYAAMMSALAKGIKPGRPNLKELSGH